MDSPLSCVSPPVGSLYSVAVERIFWGVVVFVVVLLELTMRLPRAMSDYE